MKNINKFFSVGLLFVGGLLAGCIEDIPEREASPLVNSNNENVYFAKDNSKSIALGLEDETFDVIVQRKKRDAATTIAIKATGVFIQNFEVPPTVAFAAGDSAATFTVKVKNLEAFKKYTLTIAIDDSQMNPYLEQDGRIELSVVQEDYAPYAKGTYTSEFLEDSWEQILEYSPLKDDYRFKACYGAGYDIVFIWDKAATVAMVGEDKEDVVIVPSGYVHATYGMVTINYYKDGVSYDAATQTFTFTADWTVSAGSFGDATETYEIISLY